MNGSWHRIADQINNYCSKNIKFLRKSPVSGGCINEGWKLTDSDNTHWFVKTNEINTVGMFIAEFEGLKEIGSSNSILTPKPICYGSTAEFSYLVLEFIELRALQSQAEAGKQLANMHRHTAESFGWKQNNTIGSTPQSNQEHHDWLSFWKEERLLYQLDLAKTKGYRSTAYNLGLTLADKLPYFFQHYTPKPSLLHGDLWSGNCASNLAGSPVIFDPAVYYGDRETDIAMTELFGGFNADFYKAYHQHYQLDKGYQNRKALYNLYHILNHYNLFGGGYAKQAEDMTVKLLSTII